MDKLTKEEVLHVAHLARIALTEEEIEKFRGQLKILLQDVEKINNIKGYDEELLFTPITDACKLRNDIPKDMLTPEEVLKNAPKKNGNFVEVPVMIHE